MCRFPHFVAVGLCDHNRPTSQMDRHTCTDGRHARSIRAIYDVHILHVMCSPVDLTVFFFLQTPDMERTAILFCMENLMQLCK